MCTFVRGNSTHHNSPAKNAHVRPPAASEALCGGGLPGDLAIPTDRMLCLSTPFTCQPSSSLRAAMQCATAAAAVWRTAVCRAAGASRGRSLVCAAAANRRRQRAGGSTSGSAGGGGAARPGAGSAAFAAAAAAGGLLPERHLLAAKLTEAARNIEWCDPPADRPAEATREQVDALEARLGYKFK